MYMAKKISSKKEAYIKTKTLFEVFREGKTYRNIVYLLIILPMAIFSFMASAFLLVISIGFILMPLFAAFGPLNFGETQVTFLPIKLVIALMFTILGIGLLTLSLHIINFLSDVYRRILKALD
jgi:hypothetical protein